MRAAVNVFYWLMCLSLLTKASCISCSLDLQVCLRQFQDDMQNVLAPTCKELVGGLRYTPSLTIYAVTMIKVVFVVLFVLFCSQVTFGCDFRGIMDCTAELTSASIDQLSDDICGYWWRFSTCMASLEDSCRGHYIWSSYRRRFNWLNDDC